MLPVMRSTKVIHIVGCHAEGEVGDVIVGGVAPPPGETLWDQRRFVAEDGALRAFVLNEPRGGVFRHINLLVPPKHPDADIGWIIMEPEDTPPMSGSNSICVATVLAETGIVAMTEPETLIRLEAPAGLVEARVEWDGIKARSVTIKNVPAFVDKLDAVIDVEGLGSLRVDTAYGGDSFVLVDAKALGFAISPDEARDLAETGVRVTKAANEQLGFHHPENPDWDHISFCQFTAPIETINGIKTGRNTVVVQPGKLDRSPTGTGCSARMAVLQARGELAIGEAFTGISVIDSRFDCRLLAETSISGKPAVVPEIRGRAWLTGTRQVMLDPDDPWPAGYKLSDTWPMIVG